MWPLPFSFGNPTPPPTDIPSQAQPISIDEKDLNIILIGSDRRKEALSFRTDVLIILSIDQDANAAALITIPRDLYVYLPGYSMQRINAAYRIGETYNYPGGGPGMLADAIFYNLGIPIHHYARVEMDGFRAIIDELGGVKVRVTCPYTDWILKDPGLNPHDEDNWVLYEVPSGVIEMDGDLALWYARSRARSSDFDRSRRQHEVLRAVYREILSLNLIAHLPDIYSELTQTLITDLTLSELVALGRMAPKLGEFQIRSAFIGRDQVRSWRVPISGAQVLLPDPDAIHRLLLDTLDFTKSDDLVPPTEITIEISNVSSNPDWGLLAAERLHYAGFQTTSLSLEPEEGTPSHLIDFLGDPQSSSAILQEMGLHAQRLVVMDEPASPFPFRLVIGDDYNPCFDPTRNQSP
jgi:LCP family protein required for cell wall assembly